MQDQKVKVESTIRKFEASGEINEVLYAACHKLLIAERQEFASADAKAKANEIEYDGEFLEKDLCKLFSEHLDQPSDTVLFISQLKPLLKPIKLEDDNRYYRLFEHSTVPAPAGNARWRATVMQKNLRSVANAMSKACHYVAAQYLGSSPLAQH